MIEALKKLLPFSQKFILTDEHKICLDYLENTNQNLFISGKAGTGKTSLIHHFRSITKKKVVVLAPTGIAALNIKGQTIHSFFKFPPRMIQANTISRVSNERIYMDIDCIVIDEISMVRADILDGIDRFLRLHGRDKNMPFGGVQIIVVGDMYQLPPVVSREEYEVFNRVYDSPYFFNAKSFNSLNLLYIELQTVFRQKELDYISLLNSVRTGNVTAETLKLVNDRVKPEKVNDSYVILCTTNKVVEAINNNHLIALKTPEFKYDARIEGMFPTEERNLPVEIELKLKVGARVLFVKNDNEGQWVNGTTGIVEKLEKDNIMVKIDGSGKEVSVHKDTWENIRYNLDETSGEIKSKPIGKLTQYPLKLAWAITIHKSQGMSFDKVCLDFSKSPFTHGQTYVALSRCRTLDGLILTRKIWPNDILIDERITSFYRRL
jgi:ATP-dependent exoDNAse (exonuclease V) alpha subunit